MGHNLTSYLSLATSTTLNPPNHPNIEWSLTKSVEGNKGGEVRIMYSIKE